MSDGASVLVERDETGIAVITLNRPKRLNAFTDAMLVELAQAVDQVNRDLSVKVAIVTGAGKAFCAGRDRDELAEVASREAKELMPKPGSHESSMFRALEMPTIAAVPGPAVGGGFGFVVQCDFIVASTTAVFIDGHLVNGMIPSCAIWYLPRLIGHRNALAFFCSQARMSAAQALELGLVSAVVEPENLLQAARTLAGEFTPWDGELLRQTKKLLQMAATQDYDESMQSVGFARALRRRSHGAVRQG